MASRRSRPVPESDEESEKNEKEEASEPQAKRHRHLTARDPRIPSKPFPKGSIVRVKLLNFVTYASAEFYPGPGLNVIVGPNGTGKSSIVCAICLGLGGKTQSLGRADQVKDYIKKGPGIDSAFVEIELFQGDGRPNSVIRRTIDMRNTSTWHIDGKKKTAKDVKELTNSLNIHVDNLCQLLAQDRVVAFARMNPTELLQETEKAAEPRLHEIHMRLCELRKDEKALAQTRGEKEEVLKRLEQQQEEMKRDVLRWEQKEKHLKRVELLQKKKVHVELDLVRERAKQIQVQKENAKKELDEMKQQRGPLAQQIETLKQDETRLNEEITRNTDRLRTLDTQRRNAGENLERLETQYQEKQTHIEGFRRRIIEHKKQIESKKKDLQNLIRELENLEPEENIVAQLNQVLDEIRELRDGSVNRSSEKSTIDMQLRELMGHVRQCEQRLERFRDREKQRLAIAVQRENSVEKVMQWVEQNQHRFQKGVYGPLCLQCHVENEYYAKVLEQQLNRRVMFSWVVECREDFMLLSENISNISRGCNVIQVDLTKPARRVGEISELKSLGVRDWLDELVVAPPLVKKALIDFCSIHFAAVADRNLTPDEVKMIMMPDRKASSGTSILYTPSTVFSQRFSKYSAESSSNTTKLTMSGQIFAPSNAAEINKIEQEIKDLKQQQDEWLEKKQMLDQVDDLARRKHDQLQQRKAEIQALQKKRKTLLTHVKLTEQNLESMIAEQSEQDLDRIYAEIARINEHRIKSIFEMKEVMTEWSRRALQRDVPHLERVRLKNKLAHLKSEDERIRAVYAEKERSYEILKTEFKKVSDEYKRKRENAFQVAPLEQYAQEFLEEWMPNTIDEIEQAIVQYQDQAAALDPDPQAVQRYHQRKAQIDKLQEELQEIVSNHEAAKTDLQNLRNEWEPKLRQMVEVVDKAYSDFFQRIDCSGSVSLSTHADFDKYGLEIQVQFRKDSRTKRNLSATTQSGGERSVSTMLYLLSLQGITECPFRVVDEINQGMDPTNERMIFEQIVRCSHAEKMPQYFLITPKLLPDLNFSQDITVLCVFNGPWWLPQEDWNFIKFLNNEVKIKS